MYRPRTRRRAIATAFGVTIVLAWLTTITLADWWTDLHHFAAPLAGPRVSVAARADGLVAVVNARCPLNPDRSLPPSGVPSATQSRFWRNQRVGFCSPDCPHAWDDLSDVEREEALNLALHSRETSVAPGP